MQGIKGTGLHKFVCLQCGTVFEAEKKRRDGRKYCSLKCFGQYLATSGLASQRGRANIRALHTWIARHGVWNKKDKIERICQNCGDMFLVFPYKVTEGKGLFCSLECYNKIRHNPDLPEKMRIRNTPRYKRWRQQVFMRDRFICQQCGRKPGWVEVHHLAPFMLRPTNNMKLEYGITLCRPCHLKVHGKKVKEVEYA